MLDKNRRNNLETGVHTEELNLHFQQSIFLGYFNLVVLLESGFDIS